MITYTFKKDMRLPVQKDWSNSFQKSFAIAIKNWEINQQEDRSTYVGQKKKSVSSNS